MTATINESALGPKRVFNTTVAFPSSHVTVGSSEEIEFVAGPKGDPGPPGPPGDDAQWDKMTQAAFDALPNKDPNTLYVIIG
jgi:hypothetical protein